MQLRATIRRLVVNNASNRAIRGVPSSTCDSTVSSGPVYVMRFVCGFVDYDGHRTCVKRWHKSAIESNVKLRSACSTGPRAAAMRARKLHNNCTFVTPRPTAPASSLTLRTTSCHRQQPIPCEFDHCTKLLIVDCFLRLQWQQTHLAQSRVANPTFYRENKNKHQKVKWQTNYLYSFIDNQSDAQQCLMKAASHRRRCQSN